METEDLHEEVKEERNEDRTRYTCFMIHYFAEAFKMDKPEGYLYLKEYGGLDYIRENWWALHTDNQHHAARDVFNICKRNGGYLV